MAYQSFGSSLRDLPRLRTSRRSRESSWDRTGGNEDFLIRPGETVTLADIKGAGSINHIWMTVEIPGRVEGWRDGPGTRDRDFLRRLVLRAYWDNQEHPSILVPLGDFFGIGHARTANFASAPLQMGPQDGKGFSCWFHMPFADGARFEVTSECEQQDLWMYWHIDYEKFDSLEDGLGRFHASWHRENPTKGVEQGTATNEEFLFDGVNLDGRDNYTILETRGRGHYVGCIFNITNLRATSQWNWYGEGSDMIFIDGEERPSLRGTGTEDYFNMAWGPSQAYSSPYSGMTLPGGENWSGQISMYRFHIEDPITFNKSIRVSIQHGHANKRSDDLSSVAYWYQELPSPELTIAPVLQRLPFD